MFQRFSDFSTFFANSRDAIKPMGQEFRNDCTRGLDRVAAEPFCAMLLLACLDNEDLFGSSKAKTV